MAPSDGELLLLRLLLRLPCAIMHTKEETPGGFEMAARKAAPARDKCQANYASLKQPINHANGSLG